MSPEGEQRHVRYDGRCQGRADEPRWLRKRREWSDAAYRRRTDRTGEGRSAVLILFLRLALLTKTHSVQHPFLISRIAKHACAAICRGVCWFVPPLPNLREISHLRQQEAMSDRCSAAITMPVEIIG